MSTRHALGIAAVSSLLLGAAAIALAGERVAPPRVKLTPNPDVLPAREPPPDHGGLEGVTRCELCHSTSSWANARFAHERTGYPLEGRHQGAPCKACHPTTLTAAIPVACAGCHRDAHRGDLGQRCEGCHSPASWESQFGAEAHRRTAFPLEGRHAFIPCSECHGEARDRRFSRPASSCLACHANDYARTGAAGIDHAAFGFGLECQQCHSAVRFSPARFPDHDRCFLISTGSHANLRCTGCHTSTFASAPARGTCSTFTAACTQCHVHGCGRMDAAHAQVLGYQCADRKCYECHRVGGQR